MTMPHPELPFGAITALTCLLITLPTHIKVRNVATISLNLWLCIICIISAVDSFVWSHDVIVRWRIWCDISTKLIIGGNMALPVTTFCITRFLCHVAKPNAAAESEAAKRRRFWIDVVLCWVQPCIFMGLHYIVQGHRFDIWQYIGCQPTFYDSWPSFFIITLPPLAYAFATLVNSAFAYWYFMQRRLQMDELLELTSPGMNTNKYVRLMAVSTAEMVWGTPWYLFVMISNFANTPGVLPYVSWDFVHSNWMRVGQYPLELVPKSELYTRFALWWVIPASAYLFFIFFGFSEQAMKDYRAVIRWFRVTVLRQDLSKPNPKAKPKEPALNSDNESVYSSEYESDSDSSSDSDSDVPDDEGNHVVTLGEQDEDVKPDGDMADGHTTEGGKADHKTADNENIDTDHPEDDHSLDDQPDVTEVANEQAEVEQSKPTALTRAERKLAKAERAKKREARAIRREERAIRRQARHAKEVLRRQQSFEKFARNFHIVAPTQRSGPGLGETDGAGSFDQYFEKDPVARAVRSKARRQFFAEGLAQAARERAEAALCATATEQTAPPIATSDQSIGSCTPGGFTQTIPVPSNPLTAGPERPHGSETGGVTSRRVSMNPPARGALMETQSGVGSESVGQTPTALAASPALMAAAETPSAPEIPVCCACHLSRPLPIGDFPIGSPDPSPFAPVTAAVSRLSAALATLGSAVHVQAGRRDSRADDMV